MRIQLTTIALRHSGRTFAEGAVLTGRVLGQGEAYGDDEIPLNLAQARLEAETATLVISGGSLSQATAQALVVVQSQIAAFHGQIVVFLDAVQAGSDEDVRAVFNEVNRLVEGFEPTMQRISELIDRVHPRYVFDPVTSSAARAEHTFQDQVSDSTAFSNGASEGAAAPPAAPEIPELPAVLFDVHYASPRGEWFVDKGLTSEAAEARKTQLLQMGDEPSPAVLIEPAAPAEQPTSAPNTAGAEAGTPDSPRSDGGGDGAATEAPAAVAEVVAAATSEAAQKAPVPKGGRKKSGAA